MKSNVGRLSLMMFLQYAVWGAWLPLAARYLTAPIVDGGLFTFLIIEKIQGRPISARTQAIAQVVGLAVILSVFLLVTYQDIARIISM